MGEDSRCRSIEPLAYQELKIRAYRLLARREHSCHELHQKLAPYDRYGQLQEILSVLIAEGSLSDLRFAEALGQSRYRAGKGPKVLERDLRGHQLAEEIVQTVMTHYQDLWCDLAAEVRRKKFGDASPDSFKCWAKQANFLRQRGFTTKEIGHYVDP